ncbi:MAG: excisionase family DNA-binding protein [Planctomycetes bacterium]|nr:excisionase family DNA-binding protein [Planctomycetota bacterium]
MRPKYISLTRLSEVLGLPKNYLIDHIKQGRIPFLKVGRQHRFDESQVRDTLSHIAQQEALSKSSAGRGDV